MTPPTPRRFKAWRTAAALTFIPVFIVVLAAWWLNGAADRQWTEMEKVVHDLETERDSRSAIRPVLRGFAEPGEAWTDYLLAVAPLDPNSSATTSRELDLLRRYLDGRKDIDLLEVERIVESHRASLEAFRRGTRKSSGQARVDWADHWGSAQQLHSLVTLVEARARVCIKSERCREGMDLFLDLAQMGGDVARNGDLFAALEGLGIQGCAFNGIKDLLKPGLLGPEDLKELDKELEVLDQSFPGVADVLLNDTMSLGLKFLRAGSLSAYRNDFGAYDHEFRPVSWVRRTLLPDRLLMAKVVLFELPPVRRTLDADRLAWNEARAAQWAIDGEVLQEHEAVQRPVLGEWSRGFRQLPRDFRHRRAQLRLLRVAARYGATGEIVRVADPFGQFLLCREKDGHLKIWSVGSDGVDDHGEGNRSHSWRPGHEDPSSKDIVLEMDR